MKIAYLLIILVVVGTYYSSSNFLQNEKSASNNEVYAYNYEENAKNVNNLEKKMDGYRAPEIIAKLPEKKSYFENSSLEVSDTNEAAAGSDQLYYNGAEKMNTVSV